MFFEPVSAAKAPRVAPFLKRITFLSPNAAECAAIAEAVPQAAGSDASASAARLAAAGVPNVILTQGSAGVALYGSPLGSEGAKAQGALVPVRLPAVPVAESVLARGNVNGAGDCLVAGMLAWFATAEPFLTSHGSEVRGKDPHVLKAVAFGIAVASRAVSCASNVPPAHALSDPALRRDACDVLARTSHPPR